MRIAFLTHTASLYGANRSLLDLLDGLRGCGARAHVVSPGEGPLTRALRRRGIPVAIHPIQWWMSERPHLRDAFRRWERNVRSLPGLVRQLDRWRADVVHSNSSVISAGAMVSILTGRPHVWHMRELATLHYGLAYDWGAETFRRVVGRSEALVAVSKAVRHHLARRGIASKRMRVVYDGVAWAREFDRRYREQHLRRERRRAGYTFTVVGLIHPSKGQWEAILAFGMIAAQFPHVRLRIAGDGDRGYVEGCRLLVERLRLQGRVRFLGFRPDPAHLYRGTDALLVCSRHEGMGRAAVEAMSFCRPVIGYDDGGTPELIEHGKTGLLYRGGAEELAACMRRFLKNPSRARRMGENGWRAARERFTTEAHAQRMLRVFEGALNGGDSSGT